MFVIRYCVFIVLFALGSLSQSQAFDLKKSERDNLDAELKFLTEKQNYFWKNHGNLGRISSGYLNFKNKSILLIGKKDFTFKGKNCGKLQTEFTLKIDGTGVKKIISESCSLMKEYPGVWVSKQDKVAFAYMRNIPNGMSIFVETLTIDFERANVSNYINYNVNGERSEQPFDGWHLTSYLDLDSGKALPIGTQLQQINIDRSIEENTKSKTALFGVKVLDNPSNYKIANKRKSKQVRPIEGNTLTEILEAKYGAKLEFNFYDVVPPINNKSFYDYKIRTALLNGIEVVSDINARARCPLKGIEGCQNFSDAISQALHDKYGFVVNEDIEIFDEKGSVLIVNLKKLFTIDEEFPVGGSNLLNVDGLWMSLGIRWSEESLLAKFDIDSSSKKTVDPNF